jgi:N-methylhydantoinase A/oxoprolinase/acetone carboxylase beta subunit
VDLRIGIDIGGTFTDLVVLDESTGTLTNTKALRGRVGRWRGPGFE